jgi:hypothetical protein
VHPADRDDVQLVTADEAADRLGRAPSTVRCWAFRFNARKLGRQGRKVYYDFLDLAVIDRELSHGHPVPATPEERAAVRDRCPLTSSAAA